MKNYIVKITKALDKISYVEISANSKKEIIEKSSSQFGLGIAPFTNKDITLKSENDKSFYKIVDINEEYLISF